MSCLREAMGWPSDTVRTMKPQPFGGASRRGPQLAPLRSRSMRRLMPTWSTVGMKTMYRPGRVMWVVIRAPLGPQRVLGDLDEDLLALLDEVLDRGLAGPGLRAGLGLGDRRLGVIDAILAGGLDELGVDVPRVEERGALEADIDEGGLHAGEDPHDTAEVDISDDAAAVAPADMQLGEATILDQGDPGLPPGLVDDDLVTHDGLR